MLCFSLENSHSPSRNYKYSSVHSVSPMGNMPLSEKIFQVSTWKNLPLERDSLARMNAYPPPSLSHEGREGKQQQLFPASYPNGDCQFEGLGALPLCFPPLPDRSGRGGL